MSIYRKYLFIASVSILGGLFSSQVQSASTVLYSDDFELGQGNWVNVSVDDNKEWTRDSGGTPSRNTGPASGADGSAYYMYLETSSGSAYTAGDMAILQGPSITETNIHLLFQYHMYGVETGTLAVDVLSGGIWVNDVWSISGQQQTSDSAAYTLVDVDLSSYPVSQIRFRATAAGGFYGDIAIDNINITRLVSGPVAPVFNIDPVLKHDARQDQPYIDSIAADASDANGDVLIFRKITGPTWLNVATSGEISGTPGNADVGENNFV
ncbi:MAG: hypothetical protein OQK82_05100, partial [Candidatus Pacearchaeota archaeon]|nr:hypothetical protein [Candidatus Pacearchaeota archaeon]